MLTDVHTPAPLRQGLEARIASALSSLGILARQYFEETGRADPAVQQQVEILRQEFAAGRLEAFAYHAVETAARNPLDLRGLRAADANSRDVRSGEKIYRDLCRGCHEAGALSATNPARDLFRQAVEMPEREFIARLLTGIRGTPAVALRNPFTDNEIAGLSAYLGSSPR